MRSPDIKIAKQVIPMIYAYTTPEIARHNGWTKIGYTEQKVEDRINQQTHTADILWNLEWKGTATFDDGSFERFTDKDFHAYLRKCNVEQEEGKNNEWFKITGQESNAKFYDFRRDHGILSSSIAVIPYKLREEQNAAVSMTVDYRNSHEKGEFLWNAKPRFGKTLAVYDFAKRIDAKTVLVVTNRPAIANSWFSDYARFLGEESGYWFVSEVDALKDKAGVLSRADFVHLSGKGIKKCIEFVSLQDMKGSLYFGGPFDKLKEVRNMDWDLLVVDEAHEGVDTYKTDVAFDQIKRKFTLHLSGTPFKALANAKFADNAIYNWTYADEQKAKRDWDVSSEEESPYTNLPRLSLYTYQMSEIVKDELKQGVEIQGETAEYAFDLMEFFSTNERGGFRYSSSVDKFLDAMTMQEKYPFSTEELREELKHTFWLLDRVDSAKALAKKLKYHPVFKDYEIILATGDGKLDDAEETKKSFDKVVDAISKYDKTITLSVRQLTTGVTIPEWSAVLMLSNIKSPSLYMQAAFRAQNPCMYQNGTEFKRKENAYVFDFAPERTLVIFEEFANDLYSNTAAGRGTSDTRKQNVRELLNFFPVVGEDEYGELVELDAEQVLVIPRKIRSKEVVRRGFMSNFLFQNISNVFSAPKEVMDIIEQFEAVAEPSAKVNLTDEVKESLSLNDEGEVELSNEFVINATEDLFGDKIFGDVIETRISAAMDDYIDTSEERSAIDTLKNRLKQNAVTEILTTAKTKYGDEMKPSDERQLTAKLNSETDKVVEKLAGNYDIRKKVIETERKKALQNRDKTGRTTEEINKEYDEKHLENNLEFKEELKEATEKMAENFAHETVKTVETNKREREKHTVEDGVRDHLRGFSRTIPSFLMAYGDNTVTLATFDTVIPDNVFKEVTSITLDQFKFLRDGGDYTDSETGATKHFEGKLFDQVVFDDSVKEFLALKKNLSDYFDEKSIEDIFDYIPPQKTNQIFTPKDVVKRMVDMLEKENPGCFDNPYKTFVDLYMKSGLYITEIVKRLYQSEKMKELYPDKEERLRHIFEHQVYGLAPTEIIYKIATSYILGFDEDVKITKHNFRQADALPYAKEGNLQTLVDELYGEE